MWCALIEKQLSVDKCPARCIYRSASGECKHGELAFEESPDVSHIAQTVGVSEDTVRDEAKTAVRRIQAALALDSYIGYAVRSSKTGSVNEDYTHAKRVYALYQLDKTKLKQVLNQERYKAWQDISKVDISYDEIESLLK